MSEKDSDEPPNIEIELVRAQFGIWRLPGGKTPEPGAPVLVLRNPFPGNNGHVPLNREDVYGTRGMTHYLEMLVPLLGKHPGDIFTLCQGADMRRVAETVARYYARGRRYFIDSDSCGIDGVSVGCGWERLAGFFRTNSGAQKAVYAGGPVEKAEERRWHGLGKKIVYSGPIGHIQRALKKRKIKGRVLEHCCFAEA